MYCEDCGTKYSNGLCPNCHEEAFITRTQSDYMPDYLSDEFVRKAEMQEAEAAAKVSRAAQHERRARYR